MVEMVEGFHDILLVLKTVGPFVIVNDGINDALGVGEEAEGLNDGPTVGIKVG
jgi:hypothetical protein